MKTVILCGGKGTRMKEETEFKPKPLVEIGGRPILWHIMKIYAQHGFNDFILALGYKGNMIKDYFLNHKIFTNDFTYHHSSNEIKFHDPVADDFKITFVDTGQESFTGERLLGVKKYIPENEFMVTYGDGVGDINIGKLTNFHKNQGTAATITGVHPYSKYGLVSVDKENKLVTGFHQKPLMHDYVSSGFMVFNPKIFDYLDKGPLENAFPKLIQDRQLSLYIHDGFWRGMDTYHDLEELNRLWSETKPWAIWEGS